MYHAYVSLSVSKVNLWCILEHFISNKNTLFSINHTIWGITQICSINIARNDNHNYSETPGKLGPHTEWVMPTSAVWESTRPWSLHSISQGSEVAKREHGWLLPPLLQTSSKWPHVILSSSFQFKKLSVPQTAAAYAAAKARSLKFYYTILPWSTALLLSNEVIHTIWRWCAGKWKRDMGLMGTFHTERWAW